MGKEHPAGVIGRARELPLIVGGWQHADSNPTLPFGEVTYSVSQLCGEIREALREVPACWVAGEVQRVRWSRAGHLYFELVEKGEDDEVVGKVEAVVWRREARSIARKLEGSGQEIADGLEMRCRASIDFYPPFGRLQLVVRDVDSVFALGQLARRRRETLEVLTRAGLLEANKRLELARIPLEVALVTSEGSAAYHDFLSTLSESGFGFRVLFIHASVQGKTAEREIRSALRAAGSLGADCVALVRGGGSKTDLAAFDSRLVAEAVARSPLPVLTGLGHDIDLSIADQVAHTHTKTPTQAAEFLAQRVRSADIAIAEVSRRLAVNCERSLQSARRTVESATAELRLVGLRLQAERHRLSRLGERIRHGARGRIDHSARETRMLRRRIAVAAPLLLARQENLADGLVSRIASESRGRLGESKIALDGLARLCSQLGPERTLARGFSITRNARGRVVTTREQVQAGERLTTELARGVVISRVEE